MYAVGIENTSESDPPSYEGTKAVGKKTKQILSFLRNCFSCFVTAGITFTSICINVNITSHRPLRAGFTCFKLS